MAKPWKEQPRGQPANAGQFGSKPKVQATTPEAPAVDLGAQPQKGAADPHMAARQTLLDSLPEDSAMAIYHRQNLDPYGCFPSEAKGDVGVMTSEGGALPYPEDDSGRATVEVLSLCERAFSSKAWGDYLGDQGVLHAESYDHPPSESACSDMADRCMALLVEDPDLLGEPPDSNARWTRPSEMPVATGDRRYGLHWMPTPNAGPPEAGVVYWSVGLLEDHDGRTQDVLNPEERSIRMGYPKAVYNDDHYDHRALYLRMTSIEGYDEKYGHLKGLSETLVRYTMPDWAAIKEHIMAGYKKERKRRRDTGSVSARNM